MNKFHKWIRDKGIKEVAHLLGKHERTVYWWLDGVTAPTAERMTELVRLGKGAFTYNDILSARKKK